MTERRLTKQEKHERRLARFKARTDARPYDDPVKRKRSNRERQRARKAFP